MEILIPLDKEVDVPPRTYSKNYSISNMQSMHDMKEILNFFKNILNEMMKYIQENKLTQITSVYSVNIKELKPGDHLDDMVTDLYIGVNPSIF
jgi:ERCC4-related helicase